MIRTIKRKKEKQPKALWYRALHGDELPSKPLRRIRPVSKRKTAVKSAYRKRRDEWLQGKLCECWKRIPGVWCGTRAHLASEVHHVRGRNGSLLMDERFWMALCATSHRYIHENIATAQRFGLIASKGEWGKHEKEAV